MAARPEHLSASPASAQGSAPARRLLNNFEALEGEDDSLVDLLIAANSEGEALGGRQLLHAHQDNITYQITLFSQNGDFGDAVHTDGVSWG